MNREGFLGELGHALGQEGLLCLERYEKAIPCRKEWERGGFFDS